MDGMPILTFMDSTCTALDDPAFDHDHGSHAASSSAPEELQWTLDSKLEPSLALAEKDAAELIASQAMNVVKTVGTANKWSRRHACRPMHGGGCWCSLRTRGSYARGAGGNRDT